MSSIATNLRQVDSLEVMVLVDNVMDILSSVPDSVTSEIPIMSKPGPVRMAAEVTVVTQFCKLRILRSSR